MRNAKQQRTPRSPLILAFSTGASALLVTALASTGCSSSDTDGNAATGSTTVGQGGAGSGTAATAGTAGTAGTGTPSGSGGAGGAPVSVTGIDKVGAGEYVTTFLKDGRLYGVSGTLPRLGHGDQWPDHLFPPPEVAFDQSLKIVDVAGGLHFSIATDNKGHAWEWGDIASNPDLVNHNVPVQIATDSEGNEFTLLDGQGNNVLSMAASGATSVAVKGDGTVWIWDDCSGGRQGDGTEGSATVTHPIHVPIPLPDGVKIVKVVMAANVLALASDGTVWSWGDSVIENLGTNNPDYKHAHQVATTADNAPMPPIVDIATGGAFSYALTASGDLYAWGLYAEIAGMCPGSGWCPAKQPTLSTNLVIPDGGGNGAHITSIYANSEASYAILSDGTLWGWGSNGEGLVGNGVEPDYSTTPTPYSWDWGKDDLLVAPAVNIAPDVHNFKQVFTGTADVFYAYAMTTDGRFYSWGRNKTGDLGNGVLPTNSQQAAAYPNSWDVVSPTEVNPFTTTDQAVSSPQCIQHTDAPSCWCGGGPNGPQNC